MKKILLVDDSETVLMFERMMLKELDAEFLTAKNGQEALEIAAKEKPDLIILDIMMPLLDGIETCRKMRANPETKLTPIIIVTTKGNPEKVEEAYVAGCNDFVTKPVDKMELLEKARSLLGR